MWTTTESRQKQPEELQTCAPHEIQPQKAANERVRRPHDERKRVADPPVRNKFFNATLLHNTGNELIPGGTKQAYNNRMRSIGVSVRVGAGPEVVDVNRDVGT
jgi:hypothetical protein